jgi:hypothetical protein
MVDNVRVERQPPWEQSSTPLFLGLALPGSSTASAGRSSTVTRANEALLLPGPSDAGEVDLTPPPSQICFSSYLFDFIDPSYFPMSADCLLFTLGHKSNRLQRNWKI